MKYRVSAWVDVDTRPVDAEAMRLLLLRALHKVTDGPKVYVATEAIPTRADFSR